MTDERPQVGDTRAPDEERRGSVGYYLQATDRAIRIVLGRHALAREAAADKDWTPPSSADLGAEAAKVRAVLFRDLVEPGKLIPPRGRA